MAKEGGISCTSFKKYTIILHEAIEALTRLNEDLTESLFEGHRTEAKCKMAVISLKCIDRKYRNILFDGDPPCMHCTTEYLEKKTKEREDVKQKLKAMRREYYMQEEHMSKLTRTLQDNESKLAMESIKCTHEGVLLGRLLWKATKPRKVLERLTSQCSDELHDFLNLAEGSIYAFSATYGEAMPEPNTDEYQYVTALCGILTNLSSIPDGRLFLMWNPLGRAIYTLILDIMGTICGKKAGSLKWMILIVIYNILVNPFGRKLIFKHQQLRENLEGCLSTDNCADIIGAALHIIKIFVDDFIDDNDMISVLMFQLPLKQVYSLSKSSNDMNIRKISQAIISRMEKKMVDCYNCPSCRKAIAAAPTPTAHKPIKPKKRKKSKRRLVTKSIMTSGMSVCAECETDDTDFATSESEINVIEEGTSCSRLKITSSILFKPSEKKPTKKKASIDKSTGKGVCETPSLRAKGTKKIGVKTIFKPTSSKSLDRSSVQIRSHSVGNLEVVPPQKQKSQELVPTKPKQKKLMNVNAKTVACMLSKLDLDTYLRPSYSGNGIPLLAEECACPEETDKPAEIDMCACPGGTEQPDQGKDSGKPKEANKAKSTTKVETSTQGSTTIIKVFVFPDENEKAKETPKISKSRQNVCTCSAEKTKPSEKKLSICCEETKPIERKQSKVQDECVCSEPAAAPTKSAQAGCACLQGISDSSKVGCGQNPCICCEEPEKKCPRTCTCLAKARKPAERRGSKSKIEDTCICSKDTDKNAKGVECSGSDTIKIRKTSSIKLQSTKGAESAPGSSINIRKSSSVKIQPAGVSAPAERAESAPGSSMNLRQSSSVKIQPAGESANFENLCVSCPKEPEKPPSQGSTVKLQSTSSIKVQSSPKETEPAKEKELCACSQETDKPAGRKSIESSQSSVMRIQKTSSMKLPPIRSSSSAGDEICSMQSKLMVRKGSAKPRRQSSDKCICSKAQESKKEDSKKKNINCGDECDACLITLPKVDDRKFSISEDKDKKKDAQIKTESQLLVTCTEEKRKASDVLEEPRRKSVTIAEGNEQPSVEGTCKSRKSSTAEEKPKELIATDSEKPPETDKQETVEVKPQEEKSASCGCSKTKKNVDKKAENVGNAETDNVTEAVSSG